MLVMKFLNEQLCDNNRGVSVGQAVECTIRLDDRPNLLDRATRFVRTIEERVNQAIINGDSTIFQFGEECDMEADGESFGKRLCAICGYPTAPIRYGRG
jgi:hypothetical protein